MSDRAFSSVFRVFPLRYPGESNELFRKRVVQKFRDLPEAYHLHRFDWQVFGHLTFKADQMPTEVCCHCFFALMRKLTKRRRLYFPDLCWALRFEHGTRKDRPPHIHFLIARLPEHVDLGAFCRDCVAEWRKRGGGLSKVDLYSRTLDGAGYIAKCSTHDPGSVTGDCDLTFSDVAKKYLRSVA